MSYLKLEMFVLLSLRTVCVVSLVFGVSARKGSQCKQFEQSPDKVIEA